MERFQGPARLIKKVLAVVIAQVLGPDNAVQVGLQELLDEID